MMENDRPQEFLTRLLVRTNDLKASIRFCKNNRNTPHAEINVISTCLLRIFGEMQQYLDYFQSELETKFGFPHTSEWERIQKVVLNGFTKKLNNKSSIDSIEKRFELISKLISVWDEFPKGNEETILRRGLRNGDLS